MCTDDTLKAASAASRSGTHETSAVQPFNSACTPLSRSLHTDFQISSTATCEAQATLPPCKAPGCLVWKQRINMGPTWLGPYTKGAKYVVGSMSCVVCRCSTFGTCPLPGHSQLFRSKKTTKTLVSMVFGLLKPSVEELEQIVLKLQHRKP